MEFRDGRNAELARGAQCAPAQGAFGHRHHQIGALLAPALQQIAQLLSREPQGSQIALVGQLPYQFVMVPMRAPVVIGWVVMGFPMDQALANDMRVLSGVQLALLTRSSDGGPAGVAVSTLPADAQQALAGTDVLRELPFHGDTLVAHTLRLPTANGEVFHKDVVSAAHKTLPLPSIVEVTNLSNGKKLRVRINDRGPFVDGRIIDLSQEAARRLGFEGQGVTKVRVRYLGVRSARRDDDDATPQVAIRGDLPPF